MSPARDEKVPAKTVSYVIEPEIPPSYIGSLFDFMYHKFLLPQKKSYLDISRETISGKILLAYAVLDSGGQQSLRVQIRGGKPLEIFITPLTETASEQLVSKVKEDIDISVHLFEEQIRKNTIFFAWEEGKYIVPEKISGRENTSLRRMFLETQILLIILFLGLGWLLFLFLGPLVPLIPIVLLALQFVFLFYSNRFIARSADWRITETNPTIHLLEYPLSLEEHDLLRQKIPNHELVKLKREVHNETIQEKGEIDCITVSQIFSRYGIDCKQEDLMTRRVNVYQLVKKTADRFGFPMPEIVVSNTLLPNAASSGLSPSRGVVLVTTGLLVQLDEDEIISVLGREFGHLKGRDPLWLYGLSAAQYLFMFYVLFGLFSLDLFSFFFYYWGMMTLLYFVAKFFEARADLISAIVIGQPKILAEALEKIGFRKLLYERTPSFRVQEWLGLDPHPPIYFRIARLQKLGDSARIEHPLTQSASDVTKGFLDSL
jgi:heat shock protein HtpX